MTDEEKKKTIEDETYLPDTEKLINFATEIAKLELKKENNNGNKSNTRNRKK